MSAAELRYIGRVLVALLVLGATGYLADRFILSGVRRALMPVKL